MSDHNPNQLRLIGSLAGYEKGEDVQYVAPSPEVTHAPATEALQAEAALGTLLMRDVSVSETQPSAVQEPIPDLFEELAHRESTIPSNIILGEN